MSQSNNHVDPRDIEIARLLTRNTRLKARIEALEHEIAEMREIDPEIEASFAASDVQLTRQERIILGMMLNAPGRWQSRDTLLRAICFGRRDDAWPTGKVVDVQLSHVRSKIRKAGVDFVIENANSIGWRVVRS